MTRLILTLFWVFFAISCTGDGGEGDETVVVVVDTGVSDTGPADIAADSNEPAECELDCDDQDPCTMDQMVLDGETCDTARCEHEPITQCANGDQCCPEGCNAANDDACSAICGNGIVEPGEHCDGDCPESAEDCPAGGPCELPQLIGEADACSARCGFEPKTTCESGDTCCPAGCGDDDADCPVNPDCGRRHVAQINSQEEIVDGVAAADDSGGFHIAVINTDLQAVLYMTHTSGSFRDEVVAEFDQSNRQEWLNGIAVDAQGKVHIVFEQPSDSGDPELMHARRDSNGNWETAKIADGEAGDGDLETDAAGGVHLVYQGADSSIYQYRHLPAGGSLWSNAQTIGEGSYARLAINPSSSEPEIVYNKSAGLWHATQGSNGWSSSQILSGTDGEPRVYYYGGDLAYDAAGRLHFFVSGGEYSNSVHLSRRELSGDWRAWSHNVGGRADEVALERDGMGRLYMYWQVGTRMAFATLDGQDWDIERTRLDWDLRDGDPYDFLVTSDAKVYIVTQGSLFSGVNIFNMCSDCSYNPECTVGECSMDLCGDHCGYCDSDVRCGGNECEDCVADCSGRVCGDDGCGGSCGSCSGVDEVCSPAGQCCVPDCSAKVCGDDGCGGSCGTCAGTDVCNSSGQCEDAPCDPVAQNCPSGEKCTYDGSEFVCVSDGSIGRGGTCVGGDCLAGNICVSTANSDVCRQFCNGDADCPSGGSCAFTLAGTSYGLCTNPCTPLSSSSSCTSGRSCYVANFGNTSETTDCREWGSAFEGDSCTLPDDCALNLTCVNGECRKLCNVGSTCASGSCQQVGAWLQYGVCPLL